MVVKGTKIQQEQNAERSCGNERRSELRTSGEAFQLTAGTVHKIQANLAFFSTFSESVSNQKQQNT